MLDIKVIKKENNAYAVKLNGSLDSEASGQFKTELSGIINANTRAVIVDMQKLGYISSAGISVILETKKALEALNANFAMVNLQPRIKKIFDAMKLLPIMEIFKDMPEAAKYIDQIIKEEIEKEDL
jgi:anti-sigma B factor antagonist